MCTGRLPGRAIETVTWEEFRDLFYWQYFTEPVREAKKIEFLTLRQTDSMSVAQYQSRFLMLERFAPSSCPTERERVAQFVSGLRISIRSVVAMFYCSTLAEAVTRAI